MTNYSKDSRNIIWEILPSTEEDNDWIHFGIDEFNRNYLPYRGNQLEVFKNYAIKDRGKIVAGIKSCFYFEEVLVVEVLFVDEHYRHKGLGSMLLRKVEEESSSMGAKLIHLDTFDFQAKDFYLKHGYEIFGVLENCPIGHKRYFLKKMV